ncbi:MAG: phage major capsid protein [Berryella intestinalis]|uniref:phage major capsid protein n=1 Tax=Berryella intestinalis TaxID=1531429 RepID=UPI002A57EE66|nr:phage major capsid protein [Berryella intestinalis]MDD7369716.1 phage major capsid protein [Berryella intestinalis]MDY3129281.1 phage major capsid protein [Berryella intestinalis]
MSILNSKQLWAERKRLADEQASLVRDGKADQAFVIEGQIKQLDITIDHVIEAESEMRAAPVPKEAADTFGARVLGSRDEFRGLEFGFKNVVHLGGPTEIELEIPEKSRSLLNNFASTLLEADAAGSVSYKQRTSQTGAPETWAGVSEGTSATKAKVLYAWKDAVANKETVAGYVPVSKDSLADYDELLDIIENDLVIDLEQVADAKYLNGSNSTGIVGILNTTGIQQYQEKESKRYFDAIRRMRTKVMLGSRRIPTHVCMSPEIKEAIDLYKTETGLYQSLGSDVYWGMKVVEDSNCPGILVYDFMAARRRNIHGTSVEVGYYNDQFIKNELSILAEQTKALQVRYPDAFCFAAKETLDQTGA